MLNVRAWCYLLLPLEARGVLALFRRVVLTSQSADIFMGVCSRTRSPDFFVWMRSTRLAIRLRNRVDGLHI